MNTFALYDDLVRIPDGINDLAAFRRWVHSDEFPEKGQICYLDGNVLVDLSMEQVFSHNQVKNEFAFVLTGLAKKIGSGRYLPDGLLLTNIAANLCCEPDGTYVNDHRFESGNVRFVEGKTEGYLELEGAPDMVLEVVSTSSVTKDRETLRELYWRAGIPEYWLVDAREDRLELDILCLASNGYLPTRKQADWVKSQVFGCSFRLTKEANALGQPMYNLLTR